MDSDVSQWFIQNFQVIVKCFAGVNSRSSRRWKCSGENWEGSPLPALSSTEWEGLWVLRALAQSWKMRIRIGLLFSESKQLQWIFRFLTVTSQNAACAVRLSYCQCVVVLYCVIKSPMPAWFWHPAASALTSGCMIATYLTLNFRKVIDKTDVHVTNRPNTQLLHVMRTIVNVPPFNL